MKRVTGEQRSPQPVYHFRRAIVAVTLSSRTLAVLNESFRFLSLFAAEPIILHVGEATSSEIKTLEDYLAASHFRDLAPQYMIRKGQAVAQVLNTANKLKADLIIAGALVKEGLLKSSLSKIARQLAVKAPCSVLLLVNPNQDPRPLQKVLCVVEYSRLARIAIDVAHTITQISGTNDLLFIHTFTFPKKFAGSEPLSPNKVRKVYYQQDVKLQRYLSRLLDEAGRYHTQCIHEQSRTCILDFAKEFGADLFILPAPPQTEGLWSRIFTSDFELLLQNLPCSILLTRKANQR